MFTLGNPQASLHCSLSLVMVSCSDDDEKENNPFPLQSGNTPVVKTFTVNGVSFNMVQVEGGTFVMGTDDADDEEEENDAKPAHSVTLSSYMIGETEVTQSLWQAVMEDNPSNFSGNLQRPVERVNWNECQEFLSKLNALTGEQFRLPTEAEWEYAARGGAKSRGYKYSGSNTLSDVAWYEEFIMLKVVLMTMALIKSVPNQRTS